jgi:hypothetical protein
VCKFITTPTTVREKEKLDLVRNEYHHHHHNRHQLQACSGSADFAPLPIDLPKSFLSTEDYFKRVKLTRVQNHAHVLIYAVMCMRGTIPRRPGNTSQDSTEYWCPFTLFGFSICIQCNTKPLFIIELQATWALLLYDPMITERHYQARPLINVNGDDNVGLHNGTTDHTWRVPWSDRLTNNWKVLEEPVFLPTDASLEGDKSWNMDLIINKYSGLSNHLIRRRNVEDHHQRFWNSCVILRSETVG